MAEDGLGLRGIEKHPPVIDPCFDKDVDIERKGILACNVSVFSAKI